MATKNYIRNPEFTELLGQHAESCRLAKKNKQPLPRMPDILADQAYMIARRLAAKSNFAGYQFLEDMIQAGMLAFVSYCKSFDTAKSNNGFSYCTEIMKNAFIRMIVEQKSKMYRSMYLSEVLTPKDATNYQREMNTTHEGYQDWLAVHVDKLTKPRKGGPGRGKRKAPETTPPAPPEPIVIGPDSKFRTGKPCKYCGGTLRYKSGRCVPCLKVYDQQRTAKKQRSKATHE